MGVFYIISVILTPTMLRLTLGLLCFLPLIWGHGRMPNPPGRPTMWRYGFKNPPNYNDNELFCGGFQNQMKHGYKCGLCGDPYQGPRDHEAGGRYANGIIVKTYKKGRNYVGNTRGIIKTWLQLPSHLTCEQCVLQWRYHTGNTWNCDKQTGRCCTGCGYQEEFYSCADVKIVSK